MVLYMMYYPSHLKYASVDVDMHDNRPPLHIKTSVKPWSPYAAAGILQGILLVMCLLWSARQRKLGIDDFGNPIHPETSPAVEESPIPVTQGPEDGVPVEHAVDTAVRTDVRDENGVEVLNNHDLAGEDTPLLKKDDKQPSRGWLGRLLPSKR
ncbi:hypothetical protein EIP86_003223 [Pleurotus ostreatoroseus]|nr:hypothetical protein EIP86_003223 [Pleurotus ostreatoroseus]